MSAKVVPFRPNPTRGTAAPADLNERRRADWLLTSYGEPIWTVCNPDDPDEQRVIDFRMVMPDGCLLTDHERLYATVKEFAWWFRDPRFSKVEHIDLYVSRVAKMMYLAHALLLRRIDCFSKLLPLDVEELTEDCVFGVEGVLHASERLAKFLDETPIGSLPLRAKNAKSEINRLETLRLAGIPPGGASRMPGVAHVFDAFSVRHGFHVSRSVAETAPAKEPNTCQRLSDWLTTFELLRAMEGHLEAGTISFKPFAAGASRVAAVKGSEAARTPTVPPNLALKLLERAVVWIADNHKVSASGVPGTRADALKLATACWIVIGTFSARRDLEVDGLQAGCMHGSDADGWWINIEIMKTLQRKDLIPVPAIVARAVECLEVLSADARNESGEQTLFQWLDPVSGKTVQLDCGRHIDAFADAVSIPDHTLADGTKTRWHWSPHQFRRFFAILYFWRFEGAQIEALSHHLRHFNLEMTRRYIIEDSEAAGIWHDVEWGFRSHIARAIVTGERAVSGSMGKRLRQLAQRLKEQLHKKLKVMRPEQADAILIDATAASLDMAMGRQKLVLSPKPWVTCSCPGTHDAADKAACRQGTSATGQTGPDFANAGPTVCTGCPWAVIEQEKATYVASERDRLAARQRVAPSSTILARIEAARLVDIERVIDTRYQAAEA